MSFNPFDLTGKTIVVTGASSGIGRQCAIDCSRMGARVILIARNRERLKDTFDNLQGENHLMFVADLTDSNKVMEVAGHIGNEVGKINGLVNCAGVSATLPLKLMGHDKIEDLLKSNVVSAFDLTRELSKVKRMEDGSSIIFIASVMGCVGESGKSLYSLSKGALIAGARSLACEFARRRIRVNSISPGAILTPINAELPHMADPERKAILESQHLLGIGETSDVSNGVIYLLSDASRWVTGQNLIIDGGYTVR